RGCQRALRPTPPRAPVFTSAAVPRRVERLERVGVEAPEQLLQPGHGCLLVRGCGSPPCLRQSWNDPSRGGMTLVTARGERRGGVGPAPGPGQAPPRARWASPTTRAPMNTPATATQPATSPPVRYAAANAAGA